MWCTAQFGESVTKLATVVPYKMAFDLASSRIGPDISVHVAHLGHCNPLARRVWAMMLQQRFVTGPTEAATELMTDLPTYLRNNLDRMNYLRHREFGLRVGSGAIESTHYHVTGARLKRQGMRWTETGASDMALLRADLFKASGRADERDAGRMTGAFRSSRGVLECLFWVELCGDGG